MDAKLGIDDRDECNRVKVYREDPEITKENLEFFSGLLGEVCDRSFLSKGVMCTPFRLETSNTVFGGRFISQIFEKMVQFGVIARETYEDFAWQPTFIDLIELIKRLIEAMFGKTPTTA